MSEVKTYSGGCHCGKVRYEVKLDLEKPVIACNCSMCGRSGTLLCFVPASEFQLLSGDDVLTDYQFNTHHIHHVFCSVCGVKSFARGTSKDGSATAAINTRCLDGIDLTALKITEVDGRSR